QDAKNAIRYMRKYAEEYGIKDVSKYSQRKEFKPIDTTNPSIVRDSNKCILCGACVRACDSYHGLQVLGFANRGANTVVQPMAGRHLSTSECVYCGQCAAVCPTGALTIKSQVDKVWKELTNPNKKVVVQFAPSVRVAIGEMFGLEPGVNSTKKINAALKAIGFDLVFDTNFSADLTIMEEANEFAERVTKGGKLPMFTSCCPAWVRYLETEHPEMLEHLSSCKSPQGMMGAVIRQYVPEYYKDITDENLVSVSIMPCTAKKAEAIRKQFRCKDGRYEIDYVLTTQEFGRLIKSAGVDFRTIEGIEPDSPFGKYSGAGTIFGVSGGVAEAAARTAYQMVTGEELTDVVISPMRGTHKEKIVELDLKGTKIKVKIVNTLREAEKCIREIQEGKADYQLLEVMACPGGCINGGGQPQSCNDLSIREKRAEGLYEDDATGEWRKSHENPEIKELYAKHLENPGSHTAHELLHTTYTDKWTKLYKNVGNK
ncbi:MAG: [FeFe] hydrogenase, group A, partial [Candidatus Gastranaerophilaceae bacterium]